MAAGLSDELPFEHLGSITATIPFTAIPPKIYSHLHQSELAQLG